MLGLEEIQDSRAPRYVPSSWQYGMGPRQLPEEVPTKSVAGKAWDPGGERPPLNFLFPAPNEIGWGSDAGPLEHGEQ